MSLPANDPDDLVRRKIDFEHIQKMSKQMQVPDSITVGPRTAGFGAFPRDDDHLPIRMEVPDRLRPGGNDSMTTLNETDFFPSFDPPVSVDLSLPTTLPLREIDSQSDEEVFQQIKTDLIQNVDSRDPVDYFQGIDEKQMLNKLQLLQNRVYYIERALARHQSRDRILFSCLFGCVLVQLIFSFRRSMFN